MNLDRIISYWGIGSGSTAAVPRGIQFVTEKTGWQGFVDTYLAPQRKLGISRFLLWMPFGREEKERIQTVNGTSGPSTLRFDQYQQCVKAGLKHVTEGFADAIRPLTEDGCQVIGYCGMLGGSPEIERRRWDREQWLDECLAPFKAANCDIAIDSACLSTNDYVTRLARDIRFNSSAKVYCEAMPRTEASEWAYSDVMSTEEQYQNARNPAARDVLVNPKSIRGELVRMFTAANSAVSKPWFDANRGVQDWAGYYRAKVPQAIKDGHSVCLQLRHYLEQGGKIEELS